MNRIAIASLALAAALAGCPLPQPLPSYAAGSVTPPRIVMSGISPADAIIHVPAGCATKPAFSLGGSLVDTNTAESVEARWFVDYDAANSARRRPVQSEALQPADSGAANPLARDLSPFEFVPYDQADPQGAAPDGPGVVHVVELLVSNGFDPAGTPAGADASPPYKGTSANFDFQAFRWVFLTVPSSTAVPCP